MTDKYYTISEVAERVNMSISSLRYYDYQGILSFIKKDEHGYRVFTEGDIDDILFIKELKSCGMPLRKIKDFLKLYKENRTSLEAQRKFLYAYEQDLIMRLRDDLECLQLLKERIKKIGSDRQIIENESVELEKALMKEISHIL